MTLLASGLGLWWFGHLFKRLFPDFRERLGAAGKGIAALIILSGIVLMVLGYRSTPFSPVYALPAWSWHVNNLLMLFSVILLGMGSSKGKLRAWLRHPMLTGVLVWAIAHLLVNGDQASIVLFGGLAVWSVVEMVLISAKEGPWERPEPGPISGDIRLLIIGLVLYVVIVGIHTWLGVKPFPG